MAQAKSKRRSRKRRKPRQGAPAGSAPRAPTRAAVRREARAEREILSEREQRRTRSALGVYGERPPSPFGGVPVSEVAIFAGGVGAIVGLVSAASTPLIVGVIVCTLGVVEVTAREHFSGYRSHATLLAAIPAVGLVVALVAAVGSPSRRGGREVLLAAVAVPVFALCFWLLRKRFHVARQARVARPPGP